jgi:HAUS augmin-like complex subunit 1
LAQESLPSNVVASAQVLANVANLLNIRDTELSRCVSISPFLFVCLISAIIKFEFWNCCFFSFLVAMGDISLRKTGVEEKRAKVHKESKFLLDYTRKAIARLTYLKRYVFQISK